MKRLSIIFGLIFSFVFAGSSVAEIPPIVDEAFDALSEQTGGDWSFTKTTIESKKKGETTTTVERFDPAQVLEEQWTLVSVDGESPSSTTQNGYRIEKSIEEDGELNLRKLVDIESIRLVEELENESLYEFSPIPGDDDEDFLAHLRGRLLIIHDRPYVKFVELFNEKSFSPGGPLKVKKFSQKTSMAPVGNDGQVLVVGSELEMKGKAFGVMKAEQTKSVVFSDYTPATKK